MFNFVSANISPLLINNDYICNKIQKPFGGFRSSGLMKLKGFLHGVYSRFDHYNSNVKIPNYKEIQSNVQRKRAMTKDRQPSTSHDTHLKRSSSSKNQEQRAKTGILLIFPMKLSMLLECYGSNRVLISKNDQSRRNI